MAIIKESDLFYPLNRYFSYLGYVINTEVENRDDFKRADILLTKDNSDEIIDIELKRTLSFELLDQADYWKNYTDYNYICVQKIRSKRPAIINKIIRNLGIGMIEIDLEAYNYYYHDYKEQPNKVIKDVNGNPDFHKLGINIVIAPQNNNAGSALKKSLESVIYKEHQNWSIGGQSVKSGRSYVSTYKLLMCDVYKFLRYERENNQETDGWVNLNKIVDYINKNSRNAVKNYYSNLKSSLRQAILKFEDGDIEIMNTGRYNVYRIMEDSTKYKDMITNKEG